MSFQSGEAFLREQFPMSEDLSNRGFSNCSSLSVFTQEDKDGFFSTPRVPALKLNCKQRDRLEEVLKQSTETQVPIEEIVRVIYKYVFDGTFLLSRKMLGECLKINANANLSISSRESQTETIFVGNQIVSNFFQRIFDSFLEQTY